MSRRKNSFSKAIRHLKEAPTNSTSGLYSVVPGIQTRTTTEVGPTQPDFSTVDFDIDGPNGQDTSGLFDNAGNHKFISPPGDNSYILGPMATMYYTYASPHWTRIGYIRESDRRMVNLGTITGSLEDWDGETGFSSYGQLTLEQAAWFKNTPKRGDYRAFYPGPPSSSPDQYGRYYCTITGTPLATYNPTVTTTKAPLDLQYDAIFSAILDRLKNEAGKIDWDKVEQGFNLGMLAWDVVAVLGILFPEPGTSIAGAARLATRLAGLKGIKQSLRNRFLRGALNPLGQRTVRSGAAGRVRQAVYSGRPYQGTRGFGRTTYGTTNRATGNTYTNPGALKGLRGTGGRTNPKGTLDTGTLPQRYIDKYGSRSVTGQQQIKLGRKAAMRVFGNSYDMDGNLLYESNNEMDSRIEQFVEFLQKPGKEDKLNIFFEKILDYIENVIDNEYDGDPTDLHPNNPITSEDDPWALQKQQTQESVVLSEERKLSILKNLKEPVVIPETKQKSYKVRPGRRGKTNFQGMDKLIGDIKPQESFKKPQDIWSDGWQGHNARLSQGKKNIVLEKIGEGKQAWEYMLKYGTKMDAKNLEEFWGKNPDFYSYCFDGKKYKSTRKEQVKGDYVVFLVDESGETTSMLQSELNIKLSEESDKQMLEEYTVNEPIPFTEDPLLKKVIKRLKNEIDYPDKPAVKGYPNEPPPTMVKGWHPEMGKRYKYDKLDPVSAIAMRNAPTGDPEIDTNVEKTAKKLK
jgi:hypothetical protein